MWKTKLPKLCSHCWAKAEDWNYLLILCLIFLTKRRYLYLLYGCEVWGYENNTVVDMVFIKFCKYLLGLKSSTPNCMVYGELGSYPVSLTIKIGLISFWLKLISTPDDRISKRMYYLIYRMHQNNTHQSAWLNCIRQILEQNGFGYVWPDQGLNIDHMYVKDIYSYI